MIGAMVGDIVGSIYEFSNHKSKKFELFQEACFFTDDTVMTLAIAKSLMSGKEKDLAEVTIDTMKEVGRHYQNCGYGCSFYRWIFSADRTAYNSYGNGAAMRVSACAYVAKSLDEAKRLSKIVTFVTHNHPEGIKGAEATTVATYMALHGSSIEEIREVINKEYYPMNFTLDRIRATYRFNETCQDTVPQAIMAFLESTSFEDAIRNAISVGGDSDTLAAITGAIAEAYYGVPFEIRERAVTYLDARLLEILNCFESKYGIR